MAFDLKDPRLQKFVLAGIFVLGAVYADYALVYRPQTERIQSLDARLRRIEHHVETARRRVERTDIDGLKREVESLEHRLALLEQLLPKAEEVPDLLEMVERRGIRSGIRSILFEPANTRERDLYDERVYNVSVRGKYHEIGDFLAKIGSSPRIVRTSRMHVVAGDRAKQREKGMVVATFELSTFILSDHPPKRPAGPGGKPKHG